MTKTQELSGQAINIHPLGFMTAEVYPKLAMWHPLIDKQVKELDAFVVTGKNRLDAVDRDFKPQVVAEKREAIQAELFARITELTQLDLDRIKSRTDDARRTVSDAGSSSILGLSEDPLRAAREGAALGPTVNLFKEIDFETRQQYFILISATGDNSFLRMMELLPAPIRRIYIDDETMRRARQVYRESNHPEAFMVMRTATELLNGVVKYNYKKAAGHMGGAISSRWSTECEPKVRKLVIELKDIVVDIPDQISEETVWALEKLRPVLLRNGG